MSTSAFADGGCARALCDRCKMTYPYTALRADGQSKGLQVCEECYDFMTPYALPPIKPDALALRKPRPLTHLVAYEFRNVPVYEGGPISIGDPVSYTSSLPVNLNRTYPDGYIPKNSFSVAKEQVEEVNPDDILPAFPPE